jgi:4,5-dihydroxyphthalate decarboxylase
MSRISLSLACTKYDRTEAILDGSVKPDGINCIVTTAPRPGEIFWRMLLYDEFDCSEMSLASFIVVSTHAKKNWKAIPVFTAKHFFHTDVLVNADSKIKEPLDLEGKKVGLPEYQMSAAVWSRGILYDEFGVRPERIRWFMGRRRELSREKIIGMEAPHNIDLTIMEGSTLGNALINGDIDAVLVYSSTGSLVDSENPDLRTHPKIKPLFEDPVAEALRYYKKTRIFPINHTIVLKIEIAERYPWVPTNLFKAFELSKKIAYEKWRALENWERFPSAIFLSYMLAKQREIFGEDPFAYGFKTNDNTIRTLCRYLYEQGLAQKEPDPESLFFQTTVNL